MIKLKSGDTFEINQSNSV